MTTKELARIVINALEDLKAVDIKTLDVKRLTSITDMMIIASGKSDRQVKALADKTIEAVNAKHIKPLGIEGHLQGDWVLIDLGDIIIHIMRPPIREYYQLEKLWSVSSRQFSSSL
ncbi:MAG: ribosome silencing factor [Gammaproteobacteria bacterium]|nr:ribosome silencing factor [Gammaproteobacteria bacterium]